MKIYEHTLWQVQHSWSSIEVIIYFIYYYHCYRSWSSIEVIIAYYLVRVIIAY